MPPCTTFKTVTAVVSGTAVSLHLKEAARGETVQIVHCGTKNKAMVCDMFIL